MTELDFGNIYSSTGQIVQLRYAQKTISSGSTMLAMRNDRGVVLVVAKPVTSELHVPELNHRIEKLSENVCGAYTGLLTDGKFTLDLLKRYIRDHRDYFEQNATLSFMKESLSSITYMFTKYMEIRPLGVNFLICLRDSGSYHILLGENTGMVSEYSAYAVGSGSRRAITELEKGEFDSMEMLDLVDYGIRTLYKCHDPLSEPKFNVEAAMISDDSDGKFVRITPEIVDRCVERYQHMSIDDTEYGD